MINMHVQVKGTYGKKQEIISHHVKQLGGIPNGFLWQKKLFPYTEGQQKKITFFKCFTLIYISYR